MSLDGFVAGPDQSREHPLGVGGERLHGWMRELAAWRRDAGREGGEVNASTAVYEDGRPQPRRDHHGPQHVRRRPRPVGRQSLARLVGRGSAVPPARLRADAPPARAARAPGRDVVHLRLRRHRGRTRAGPGRRGRTGRGRVRRSRHRQAVPRGRADRRAPDPPCAGAPGRGCAPVRRPVRGDRGSSRCGSSGPRASPTSPTASCAEPGGRRGRTTLREWTGRPRSPADSSCRSSRACRASARSTPSRSRRARPIWPSARSSASPSCRRST